MRLCSVMGEETPVGMLNSISRSLTKWTAAIENPRGREHVTVDLTPATIPEYVEGIGRTLVCVGCGTGQEPLAQAFLKAGFKEYIAQGNYINANAAMMIIIGFFYHLLMESRIEDEPTHHTDEEAVALAAALDSDYPRGTRVFHYL